MWIFVLSSLPSECTCKFVDYDYFTSSPQKIKHSQKFVLMIFCSTCMGVHVFHLKVIDCYLSILATHQTGMGRKIVHYEQTKMTAIINSEYQIPRGDYEVSVSE